VIILIKEEASQPKYLNNLSMEKKLNKLNAAIIALMCKQKKVYTHLVITNLVN
jgi:hypothetical protein